MPDMSPPDPSRAAVPGPAPAAPLYAAVARTLMREIMAGRLPDGARLPPEREMAAEMGVAVGTLRRALADLAERGLLDRRQGSGNYIRAGAEIAGVYAFFRLERPGGGGVPSVRILGLARAAKPAGAPPFGPSPEAQRLRRLRHLDDTPAALEEIWLDAGRVPDASPALLEAPLYHALRGAHGLWIAEATDRVGLGRVPDWAPSDFGLSPGAPCPYVERTGRAQDGTPVEHSRTWIDPAEAVYVQRIT
jgi:GntR family transcriptional regulator